MTSSDAPQWTAPPPGEVAARIGDRQVTVGELDERWRQRDPVGYVEAHQRIYDGRKTALDNIIAGDLIEHAAAARGMPPDALVQTELDTRVAPVTDRDVAAFYESNRDPRDERSLAEVRAAIQEFIGTRRQAEAFRELVAELGATGPSVRVTLDVPRHEVEVADLDPSRGPADAPVTIVEFSDFQCPFCAQLAPTLARVRQTYGDRVRIVWKDFPLTSIHPDAFKAAEAAHCAGDQGAYWEYHDRLFTNQDRMDTATLVTHASAIGLDLARFRTCLTSSIHAQRVRHGIDAGGRLGVSATPMAFINGRPVSGAQPYEAIAAVIDDELTRVAE